MVSTPVTASDCSGPSPPRQPQRRAAARRRSRACARSARGAAVAAGNRLAEAAAGARHRSSCSRHRPNRCARRSTTRPGAAARPRPPAARRRPATSLCETKPLSLDAATSAAAGSGASASSRRERKDQPMTHRPPPAPEDGATRTIVQVAGEDALDRRGDLVDRRHAVDPRDQPARFVDRQDRRGLGAVFGHAGADGFLVVVGRRLNSVPPHWSHTPALAGCLNSSW